MAPACPPADAARALILPHATSKLRAVDDLWGLVDDGLPRRGAAVDRERRAARADHATRAGDLAATRVDGDRRSRRQRRRGRRGRWHDRSRSAELFANVPARLKFLKGEGTEASHVTDLVAKLAMAHPRAARPPAPQRPHRARAAAGSRWASRARKRCSGSKIAARHGADPRAKTAACASRPTSRAPELAQTTARGVQLFVGRRPVRDRGLLHAVAMGYGELVPRGRYPVAVVLARRALRRGRPQRAPAEDRGPVRGRRRGLRGRPACRAGSASRAPRGAKRSGGADDDRWSASVAPPQLPWDGAAGDAARTPVCRGSRERADGWLVRVLATDARVRAGGLFAGARAGCVR